MLNSADREQAPGTWLSHEDARTSVMMQVPHVGPFVRCLLPVHLSGGFAVTFGVWIGVDPATLQHAFSAWWSPDYASLVLEGRLANALPGWGLLGVPVRATVRRADETPYCTGSTDPSLARVLTEEWPHESVLAALDGGDVR